MSMVNGRIVNSTVLFSDFMITFIEEAASISLMELSDYTQIANSSNFFFMSSNFISVVVN